MNDYQPREIPNRWAPVEEFLIGPTTVATGGVTEFEPLPPVPDELIEKARESVPVEADDDTEDDTEDEPGSSWPGGGCPPDCTVDHHAERAF